MEAVIALGSVLGALLVGWAAVAATRATREATRATREANRQTHAQKEAELRREERVTATEQGMQIMQATMVRQDIERERIVAEWAARLERSETECRARLAQSEDECERRLRAERERTDARMGAVERQVRALSAQVRGLGHEPVSGEGT